MYRFSHLLAGVCALLSCHVLAYRVPIADTDALREVCSGMWGGKEAYIEVSFNPSSAGQVALVIYEWSDVPYLGVDTPDTSVGGVARPKTYICTTSAVRSGLCSSSELGVFITSPPDGKPLNSTSIFTTALKFDGLDDHETLGDEGEGEEVESPSTTTPTTRSTTRFITDVPTSTYDVEEPTASPMTPEIGDVGDDDYSNSGWRRVRGLGDLGDRQDWGGMVGGVAGSVDSSSSESQDDGYDTPSTPAPISVAAVDPSSDGVVSYTSPITYAVRKTGYYCIGIVPVTLVNARSELSERQAATHAEYSGLVFFHNTFDGELPAVEYPKINFYLGLSVIYFILGCGWGYLCFKYRDELLPMQYYISGTIIFLVIEMLANFAYYRYINKHGGGASSLAFLFVVAILNAARNSLSFFLLLIVSMGLSVVRQSLGSVMTRVRILTGLHFIFGVLYSVGIVEVELDSASLALVMLLIFPLALTLTAFLMWIIVSLNGTIMHLQAQKQRTKLQMFQRLWRILILAVIAIAAFFVVSSMSLSNRLDEDYAPSNWRYRWILLDGSLATIYLCVFAAISWIWRPTGHNLQFAMSQELAQDEADADAEDYEIDNLENGRRVGHQPLSMEDDEDDDEHKGFNSESRNRGGPRGEVGEENVVFSMGDASDEEDDEVGSDSERRLNGRAKGKGEYRDDGSDSGSEGGRRGKDD